MPDFSGLADLASAPITGWAPPSLDDLSGPDLAVLALDQSLNSTGAVVLARQGGGIRAVYSHTLRGGGTEATGFIHDYRRAIRVERQVATLLSDAPDLYDARIQELLVVHETPPAATRKLPGAGASSKAAGQAVWHACARLGIEPVILNAQQGKKFVCGNAKADKAEAHDALKRYVFPWLLGADQITNEHERDAAIIGLLALSKNRG